MGKLILGLLVPLGSTSRITGGVVVEVAVVTMVVVGISGTSATFLSHTSVDAQLPMGILAFLLSTAAKNCCVDANASLLASFVACMTLGTS